MSKSQDPIPIQSPVLSLISCNNCFYGIIIKSEEFYEQSINKNQTKRTGLTSVSQIQIYEKEARKKEKKVSEKNQNKD